MELGSRQVGVAPSDLSSTLCESKAQHEGIIPWRQILARFQQVSSNMALLFLSRLGPSHCYEDAYVRHRDGQLHSSSPCDLGVSGSALGLLGCEACGCLWETAGDQAFDVDMC